MNSATHNQFSKLHFDLAEAQAAFLRLARLPLVVICLFVLALMLFVPIAAFQILFVGALDRMGIPPQHSFLALNLPLLSLLLAFTLYPRVVRTWQSRRQVEVAEDFAGAQTAVPPSERGESMCELLIIRRLDNQKNNHDQALRLYKRRSDVEAITITN